MYVCTCAFPVSFYSLSLFFQVRSSSSQANLADVMFDDVMDDIDFPDQARTNMMPPSTSTPKGDVQRPNIGRGGSRVTRSTARYLSTCLFLSTLI